jgi:hypothetical protein
VHKYGTNSVGAVLRVLVIAKAVDRTLNAEQAKLLAFISAAKGVKPPQLMRIVEEYAADLAVAQTTEKEYFLGDQALPRQLVQGALDEIEGGATQLQIAQVIHALMKRGAPTKQGVLFVEAAVAYWGIQAAWKKWLGESAVRKRAAAAAAKRR